MQFLLKVGTDPATAKDRFAEFAGAHFYGPYDGLTAKLRKEQVEAEFIRLVTEHGTEAFIYGKPVVELVPLWSEDEAPGPDIFEFPVRAASNWHLTVEEQAHYADVLP